ncbi:MAG TPA: hemerythrin domain-containing protein [Methanosarcina sp.]|nr:hemerythrin domain-containing protein [Methanosarcina sp.]
MNEEAFVHYKIGITVLDDQHWELFKILNDVNAAKAAGETERSFALLQEFFRLLDIHQAVEEQMMRESKYPFADNHIVNHPENTGTVRKICESLKGKQIGGNYCYIPDLIGLIGDHIDWADREFANWLESQNKI